MLLFKGKCGKDEGRRMVSGGLERRRSDGGGGGRWWFVGAKRDFGAVKREVITTGQELSEPLYSLQFQAY